MVCSCLLVIVASSFAQSEEVILKKKRALLKSEIRDLDKSISSTRDEIESLEYQVILIQERAQLIDSLTVVTQRQVDFLDLRIQSSIELVEKLETRKQKLKTEYAAIYKAVYRHHYSTNSVVMLLSASSLSDALLRWSFLRNIEQLKSRRYSRVIHATEQLNSAQTNLQAEYTHQKNASLELDSIRVVLDDALEDERKVLKKKKKESKKLKQLKKERKKEDRALKNELDALVAELNLKKPSLKSSTSNTTSTTKRSRFSKPVPGNFITNKQLKQEQVSDIFTTIRTSHKQDVKAVESGIVQKIAFKPLKKNIIMIFHSESNHFSMYANLGTVYVSEGDIIKRGDPIGQVSQSFLSFALGRVSSTGKRNMYTRRELKKIMQ